MVGAERKMGKGKKESDFRWPWQKDESLENSAKNGVFGTHAHANQQREETPVVKRVSHSDSKPAGSFAKSGISDISNKSGKEAKGESLQKRLDSIVGSMVLSLTQKKSKDDEEKGAPWPLSGKAAEKNGLGQTPYEQKSEDLVRSESVSDLYSPPSDVSDEVVERSQPAKKRATAKWPRMPWQRDEKDYSPGEKIGGEDRRDIETKGEAPLDALGDMKETSDSEHTGNQQRDSERKIQITIADGRGGKEAEQGNDDTSTDPEKANTKEREPVLPLPAIRTTQLKINPFDIGSIPQRDIAAIRLIFGSETFFATETLSPPGGLIFRGNLRGEPTATLAKLEQRLAARLGDKYSLCLAQGEEDLRPVVVVVPSARDKRPASPRQRLFALMIALATVSTCLGRGLYAALYKPVISAFYPAQGSSLATKLLSFQPAIALLTSSAILFVILVSQLIQRLVASWHGTRVALPYLIPSIQLGSFGAVVQLASPTPTRAALFDIALAGAASLVLVSLGCLLVGLRLSTGFPYVVPVPMSTVSNSIVIGFLTRQVPQGQILVDYGRSLIGLHPLAVIGANCLTIAALNLLPIRQLDGGRIISALYGRRTAVWASRVTVLFLLLASTKSPYFVMFLAAVTFGPWSLDRPAKNELTEPNGLRTIVGYLFMLLMIGVLLPHPASKFFGTM